MYIQTLHCSQKHRKRQKVGSSDKFFEFSEINFYGDAKILAWKWYENTQIVLLEQIRSILEQLFWKNIFLKLICWETLMRSPVKIWASNSKNSWSYVIFSIAISKSNLRIHMGFPPVCCCILTQRRGKSSKVFGFGSL